MERTKELVEKELKKAIKTQKAYIEKKSIKTLKESFITCKKCKSRLNREKIKGECCPLCGFDLRPTVSMEKIKENALRIKELKEELENMEEVIALKEKEGFRVSDIEIIPKNRPAYKKILEFMKEKYGKNYGSSRCATNDKYIVAVNENFTHSATYFSALFDVHIFDKNGELLAFKNNAIEGTSYSDFYIDRLYLEDGIFKMEVRSHLSPYSKCSDEYCSIWYINISDVNYLSFRVFTSRFIFVERRSERDYHIYNEKSSNKLGNYYIFTDLKGHTPQEVSENRKLFDELYDEAFSKNAD